MRQHIQLSPEAIRVMSRVATEYADKYIRDFMYPHLTTAFGVESGNLAAYRESFANPKLCLSAFFCHYAFARRGKDREILSSLAMDALKRVASDVSFEDILKEPDGSKLWDAFVSACADKRHKNNEPQNRGIIQGMLELSQEIYALDGVGSIAGWVVKGVLQNGHVEPQFLRVVDIRGVGPKCTSTFMRDIVHLFGLEDKVEPKDKLYIQPVDRWLRLMARLLIDEPGMEGAADWVIAGKMSKYTRIAKVSSIRFNMGTTYFGNKVIRDPDRFDSCIEELVTAQEDPNAEAAEPPSF